jgi:hypothetical protein
VRGVREVLNVPIVLANLANLANLENLVYHSFSLSLFGVAQRDPERIEGSRQGA